MTRDVKGNVAVVTGGGGPHGIGAATGKLLAQRGCRVVLSDVNGDALETTAAELSEAGLEVTAMTADVTDFSSMQVLADTVFDDYGRVDIVFLNAGIMGGGGYFEHDDLQAWQQVFAVNPFGIVHGIKAFVPRMIDQGTPGDVLGTTSGAGAIGVSYQMPAYAASKSAVLTLMEGLYGKLTEIGSSVRAHAVFPPLTRTDLMGSRDFMPLVQQGLESSGVSVVLAEPEEVAATVLEAIESGSFWAHHDREADERLSGGKFAVDIDWQDMIIEERAKAIVNRTPPDPYLWGKPPA